MQFGVSNSLVFVLSRANEHDLASIIHGLRKYVRALPTRGGHRVELVYHADVTIDRDLEARESPKPPVRELVDFAAYTGSAQAWTTVIDTYAQAFPGGYRALNVARPIWDDGVVEDAVARGRATLGKRFCLQHNALAALLATATAR